MDHGQPIRSAAGVLGVLASRLRRDYVDGGAGPKDIIHRTGMALTASAGSDRPRGHMVLSEAARIAACGGRTLSWENGCAGIRCLTDKQMSAIGADVRGWLLDAGAVLPSAWASAREIFLPRSNATDIELHRLAVPAAPFMAWVSRAVLQDHIQPLQPKWLAAGSAKRRGRHPYSHGAAHRRDDRCTRVANRGRPRAHRLGASCWMRSWPRFFGSGKGRRGVLTYPRDEERMPRTWADVQQTHSDLELICAPNRVSD